MKAGRLTRRELAKAALVGATAATARAQELIGEPPGRMTPREEIVNVFEMEAVARRKLPENVYVSLSGGSRRAFDRITFRPRMLVNVTQLDLSLSLFGEKLFTPIVVAPIGAQKRFHPDGELGSLRGASTAQAPMMVSIRSDVPLESLAAQSKTSLWFQVYAEPDPAQTRIQLQNAVRAGCKAVCMTVGVPFRITVNDRLPPPSKLAESGNPTVNWDTLQNLRESVKVPFLLKGIMNAEDAQNAVKLGFDAVIVSNHGGVFAQGLSEPIEALPAVADAVAGKIPVLIDGGFRRGTDVLKALALGARAVLVGRPVMWGLAAYGAEGVQTVLQLMQSELARGMALSGKPSISAVDRNLVKIHLR
jgi:4-hydroxymandelate oxidase